MLRLRAAFVFLAVGVLSMRAAETRATVAVAAAANLHYALEAVNAAFEHATPGGKISVSYGASGGLLAQIEHGAPFDVFLSADTTYPQQLVAHGFAHRDTMRTFAVGRLVVWTTRRDLDLSRLSEVLRSPDVTRIAIARPETAPYGRAAQRALENLRSWSAAQPKLVFGENISQTAQFVDTGNADIGFVALSLVLSSPLAARGKWIDVAPSLYADVALDHAAVLTKRGADNAAARKYLDFLGSPEAVAIFKRFGYTVPDKSEGVQNPESELQK